MCHMQQQLEALMSASRGEFIAFVQNHYPLFSAAAEDLVHDASLRVLSAGEVHHLKAFFWRGLRNVCIDEYRHRWREDTLASQDVLEVCDEPLPEIPVPVSDGDADPIMKLIRREERALLVHALEIKRTKSISAVLLALVLSHEEIGRILSPRAKNPDKNAAVLIFQGLSQLRQLIEKLSSRNLTPLTARQFAREIGQLLHQRFGLKLEPELIPAGLYKALAKIARRIVEDHRTDETAFEAKWVLARCCYNLGLYTEAQSWFDQLLAVDVPDTIRIRIRSDFARFLQEDPLRQFRKVLWHAACDRTWAFEERLNVLPDKFARDLQRSESLLQTLANGKDPVSEIYVLHRLGNLALLRKEMEVALDLYNRALRHAEALSRPISIHHLKKAISKVKIYKALQARVSGETGLADSLLEEADQLLKECLEIMPNYPKGHADAYLHKGIVAMARDESELAYDFFHTVWVLAEQVNTPNHATDAVEAMQWLSSTKPLIAAVEALSEAVEDIRYWGTVDAQVVVKEPTFQRLLDSVMGLRSAHEEAVAEARERDCEAAFWRVIYHTLRFLNYAVKQLKPTRFDDVQRAPRGLWRIAETNEPEETENVLAELAKRYRNVEGKAPGLIYLVALLHDGFGLKAFDRANHESMVEDWITELPVTLVLQSQTPEISDGEIQALVPFVAKHSSLIATLCFRRHHTKEAYFAFRLFVDGLQKVPGFIKEPAKRQMLIDMITVLSALDVASIRDRGELRHPAQLKGFLLAAEGLGKQRDQFCKAHFGQPPRSLQDIAVRLISQREKSEEAIVNRLLEYLPYDFPAEQRAETESQLRAVIANWPAQERRMFREIFSLIVELKYLDNVALPALITASPNDFLAFLREICATLQPWVGSSPEKWLSVALREDVVRIGDIEQANRFVERFSSAQAAAAWAQTASVREDEWVVEATYNLSLSPTGRLRVQKEEDHVSIVGR